MDMYEDPNELTIQAYNESVRTWIEKTPQIYGTNHQHMLRWIDVALAAIPHGGSVLELGSATSRDATYMRSKGFRVQCSDASHKFIDNLRSEGENALHLNVLTMPITGDYDMIIANAVLPHFTDKQVLAVLQKIYKALRPGCLFAFDVKQGHGETWIVEKIKAKRFVHYWQPSTISAAVRTTGFEILFMDQVPGDSEHRWINIVAKKPFVAG